MIFFSKVNDIKIVFGNTANSPIVIVLLKVMELACLEKDDSKFRSKTKKQIPLLSTFLQLCVCVYLHRVALLLGFVFYKIKYIIKCIVS